MAGPGWRDLEQRQIAELVAGESERIDRLRTVLEAALGTFPAVGSGLAGLFKLCWGPAFERRTRALLEMLCERLLDVEDDIDGLRMLAERLTDPDVAAMGLSAISMAGRTSSEEKLRHLATCVAQIIENRSPWVDDVDFAQMLMHLVDDLTATQIAVLQFLAHPTEWEQRSGLALDALPLDGDGRLRVDTILTTAFPGYMDHLAALRAILDGLEARGLVTVSGLAGEDSSYPDVAGFREGSASALGIALLGFLELDPGSDPSTARRASVQSPTTVGRQ